MYARVVWCWYMHTRFDCCQDLFLPYVFWDIFYVWLWRSHSNTWYSGRKVTVSGSVLISRSRLVRSIDDVETNKTIKPTVVFFFKEFRVLHSSQFYGFFTIKSILRLVKITSYMDHKGNKIFKITRAQVLQDSQFSSLHYRQCSSPSR